MQVIRKTSTGKHIIKLLLGEINRMLQENKRRCAPRGSLIAKENRLTIIIINIDINVNRNYPYFLDLNYSGLFLWDNQGGTEWVRLSCCSNHS